MAQIRVAELPADDGDTKRHGSTRHMGSTTPVFHYIKQRPLQEDKKYDKEHETS